MIANLRKEVWRKREVDKKWQLIRKIYKKKLFKLKLPAIDYPE
jgi:hypothetical protein